MGLNHGPQAHNWGHLEAKLVRYRLLVQLGSWFWGVSSLGGACGAMVSTTEGTGEAVCSAQGYAVPLCVSSVHKPPSTSLYTHTSNQHLPLSPLHLQVGLVWGQRGGAWVCVMWPTCPPQPIVRSQERGPAPPTPSAPPPAARDAAPWRWTTRSPLWTGE